MGNAALDAAIAAAVPEALAELNGEEAPPAPKVTAPVKEAEDIEEEEEAPAPGSSQEVETEVATEEEDETEDEPLPTHLFGVDLSVLPDDDARREFIREFTEQNKTISKLQREVAELRTPAPEPEDAGPAEPEQPDFSTLTDEELAQALGIDLENALDPEMVRLNLGLTRKVLELSQVVETVQSTTAETAETRVWEAKLDELERVYGELPVSRQELRADAKAKGLNDPEAAFWSVAGPARVAVAEALDKRLKAVRTTAKKAATTPRPKTSADVVPARLKATTAKDAVKEAAELAMAELGITLSDN